MGYLIVVANLHICHPLNMLNGFLSGARAADRQYILYNQSVGKRKLRSRPFKANNCGRYSERIRLSELCNSQLGAPIRNVQTLHTRNVSVRASGSDDDRAELDPRGAGDKLVLCISQDAEVCVSIWLREQVLQCVTCLLYYHH